MAEISAPAHHVQEFNFKTNDKLDVKLYKLVPKHRVTDSWSVHYPTIVSIWLLKACGPQSPWCAGARQGK